MRGILGCYLLPSVSWVVNGPLCENVLSYTLIIYALLFMYVSFDRFLNVKTLDIRIFASLLQKGHVRIVHLTEF